MTILAKILLGLGIISLILTFFLIFQRYAPVSWLSLLDNEPVLYNSSLGVMPSELVIPELNIDLPVFPASFQNGKWETTGKGVSYSGNNVFYGHNWPNLLGKITKLKVGDIIELKFKDGTKKDYTIANTSTISPEDISILSNKSKNIITLYTCTGFFDSKRFVIVAQ